MSRSPYRTPGRAPDPESATPSQRGTIVRFVLGDDSPHDRMCVRTDDGAEHWFPTYMLGDGSVRGDVGMRVRVLTYNHHTSCTTEGA